MTLGCQDLPMDASEPEPALPPPTATPALADVSTTPPTETSHVPEAGCLLVTYVASHSPAQRGGLEPGDVVAAVNGQPAIDVLLHTARRPLLARRPHVYACYRGRHHRALSWDITTADGFPLGATLEPTTPSARLLLASEHARHDDALSGALLYALWKAGEWRALLFFAAQQTGVAPWRVPPRGVTAACTEKAGAACALVPCLYLPEPHAHRLTATCCACKGAAGAAGALDSPALLLQGAALFELGCASRRQRSEPGRSIC
jgi:hypothetical protein